MTEEPKKNHWYEMYELECLKTKDLEKQNEILAKHILELQADKGRLTDELTEARETIRKLCGTVRALNNPNTQLTDVNGFLQNAEAFLKE